MTKEMKATIVRIAPDTVCAACHTTTGHQQHPAYDGQPPPDFVSTSVAASPSYHLRGYNIKTCGSCHYNQYKQWGTEQHADLSAQMPAKYRSNQECLACHPNGHGVAGILTAGADPSVVGNHIDAACESCHGPGREHVRFNVRFIAYPPLGPKLEQAARQSIRTGKAANTCIQCHVSQRHQPHPEYEKENATETKS